MKNSDQDQRISRVWGDPPASTQGAGKPARGVASTSRRAAGVVVDVPATPEILKLNRELLALQSSKNGSGQIEPEGKPSKSDIPVLSPEEFITGLNSTKTILREKVEIEGSVQANYEALWPEKITSKHRMLPHVDKRDIVKYGLAAALEGREQIIICSKGMIEGVISAKGTSSAIAAHAQQKKFSYQGNNTAKQKSSDVPKGVNYRDVFANTASLERHIKTAKGSLKPIFAKTGSDFTLGTARPYNAVEDANRQLRKVAFFTLKDQIEQSAETSGDMGLRLKEIFGPDRELLICDGFTQKPLAVFVRPDDPSL